MINMKLTKEEIERIEQWLCVYEAESVTQDFVEDERIMIKIKQLTEQSEKVHPDMDYKITGEPC